MLYIVVAVIGVVFIAVLIRAATKPNTFRVERKLQINTPPEKIFPFINDFRRWTAWSPYEGRDPNMKRIYGNTSEGQGATYRWEGAGNVGIGRMAIKESTPSSKIVIKLDFEKPIEGHNTAEFTLVQVGNATDVTWAMYGPASFGMRFMSTMVNMDAMIGNDFAKGLANLKTVAEK